jgi:hypothetical protein
MYGREQFEKEKIKKSQQSATTNGKLQTINYNYQQPNELLYEFLVVKAGQ